MGPLIIAAGVLAAGQMIAGGLQYKAQKEGLKAQRDAQKQQTAIEVEKNKVAARNVIREARIRRAAIVASSVNTGSRGSGEAGATGSIGSMAGAALGFQGMQSQAAMNTTRMLGDASRAEGRAAGFNALGNAFASANQFIGYGRGVG